MSFSINSNLGAAAAYNSLAKVTAQTQSAQLRLASSKKINSVSDDTSGYQVGKALQGKVSIMKGAQGNISSAKNLLATAEAALSSINDLVIQIKGKVADASDPTKNKTSLAADITALGAEIKSIFDNTKFNETALLSGTSGTTSFEFKTGDATGDKIAIDLHNFNAATLGSITASAAADLLTVSTATILSGQVDDLSSSIQDALGSIGNYGQRLDVKDEYLTNAISNANASISRIFDTDMALEQMDSTKSQVGGQIGVSMLAQMNQTPSQVMGLFR
ncbi:MAG: flagellin [Ignavibacteriaceae bacterium]|jgi:flagellin